MDFDFGAFLGGATQGALSYMGSNKANKKNRQIADEANEAAIKLARYQMDLEREQTNWLWDNYNSPEAMKAHGLNPNIIYGNGGSGIVKSISDAPSVPYTKPEYNSPLASTAGAVATMFQLEKMAQQVDALALKNGQTSSMLGVGVNVMDSLGLGNFVPKNLRETLGNQGVGSVADNQSNQPKSVTGTVWNYAKKLFKREAEGLSKQVTDKLRNKFKDVRRDRDIYGTPIDKDLLF